MIPRKNVRVPGPYGATLNLPLDKGDAGIDQTAAAMAAVIHSAAASAGVQDFARSVVPPGSPIDRAAGVYAALQRFVEFKKDPAGVEMLRHPDQLVYEIEKAQSRADPARRKTVADCDDVAMLGAAMLLALGIDAALVVMAPEPGDFKHVYFAAMIGGLSLPLDPQETTKPFVERAADRRRAYRL